ncbi:MAG: DUF2817 domain-containing protein [Actinomycetota bacterium]|nr:DUF2817 domain-containing protein [Actinomycetota bacterium]
MYSFRIAISAGLAALMMCLLFAGSEPGFAANSSGTPQTIGKSVKGRAIVATHRGPESAPVRIVVLGQMHGNERAGRRIVSLLQTRVLPAHVQLWLISTVNPDGAVLGTRRNANKVDINRNFPSQWRTSKKRSPYYPGPSVASEPETQSLMAFLSEVKPTAVLSFHQAYGMVDDPYPRGHAAAKKFGALLGLPTGIVPCRGVCRGTMTAWVNSELQAIGLTVELRSKVTPAGAQRAASAVIGLAAWLAGTPVPTPALTPAPEPTASPTPTPIPTQDPNFVPAPTPSLIPPEPADLQ